MAKTTKQVKGRRVMPKVRRHGAAERKLTLGELVAAAFDIAGGDSSKAQRLLGSREMAQMLGRRIVIG